jgi:hypothetical protein
MRNIRHINIEIDKQDFIKKLGIKDVDVEDIVNKVVEKIPKNDAVNLDEIVSKVIELLPKPKKSVKTKDVNVDDIVAKVLLSIKLPEPKIIETIQKVDVTVPELVEKINTVSKEIDWKVLKNIPYDVLNKKSDHAIHRGGMSRFTQLLDVPQSYTGQSGNALRVKTDLTGLEFYTPAGDTDEKVKVSSNDTTAGYLNGKLVAGTGITLTENNNGGNETFTIAATGSGLSSFTSPNSTITVGGTLTDPTVDIDLAHSNTYTTYQAVNDGTYYAGLADSANSAAGYFYNSSGDSARLGYGNFGGYFSGVTDGVYATNSGGTYSAYLSANSYSAAGYFADTAGNNAALAYNGGTGIQATGTLYGGSFYAASGIYTAFLASDNEASAGYFSNTSTGNYVYLADGSYPINASGNINTDSDYYISGSPIGVSHWSNDAGYITGISGLDHNSLGNLTVGDVHTQYAYLTGRSGGQTLIGGTASGNNLTFRSTSNATRGKVIFGNAGTTAYDEVNERFGIGTASPQSPLDVRGNSAGRGLRVTAGTASGMTSQTNLALFETSAGLAIMKIGHVLGAGTMAVAAGFGSGSLGGYQSEPFGGFDIAFGGSPATLIIGAENNATTRTNSTSKLFRIAGAPYNTAAEPMAILVGSSNASTNLLNFGGGTSILQGATQVSFSTTPTIETDGIQRMSIFGSGRVAIGTSLTESYSAKLAVVNTDTTTDATLELRSMASQTGNILSARNSAGSLQAYLENTTNPNGSALLRVGLGTNYGNYQERAILGYYSPPDSAAGWDRNQAVMEAVLDVTNASTAFNTYGGYAMYYRTTKSGAGFVENLSGAGGQVEVTSGAGNIGSVYGFYSVYQNSSTNTVSEVFGTRSYFGQSAANTTSSLYGSQLWFAHSGSTNVTNTYGYHLRNSMGTVGTMTNMYGFYMQDFTTKVTNVYGLYILGATSLNYLQGSLEIDGALNHDGTTVGFYGATPVAQSSAYTVTNGTTDRAYDADATTVNELADVVATLIADLKATGIIG